MLVRDMMISDVQTVTEEDTLEQAVILFQRGRFRHLPVVKPIPQPETPAPRRLTYPPPKPPAAVVGILSDRDLPGGRIGELSSEELGARQVREVMRRPVITVSPDTPIEYAATLTSEEFCRLVRYPLERKTQGLGHLNPNRER